MELSLASLSAINTCKCSIKTVQSKIILQDFIDLKKILALLMQNAVKKFEFILSSMMGFDTTSWTMCCTSQSVEQNYIIMLWFQCMYFWNITWWGCTTIELCSGFVFVILYSRFNFTDCSNFYENGKFVSLTLL